MITGAQVYLFSVASRTTRSAFWLASRARQLWASKEAETSASALKRSGRLDSNCFPHFSQTPPRFGVVFTMRSLRRLMSQVYRRAEGLLISNGTTTPCFNSLTLHSKSRIL